MAKVRVGSLTARQDEALVVTPSGLLRPGVFHGDDVRAYTDRQALMKVGKDLVRHGGLLVARGVPYRAPSAAVDQICAREHAKACQALDRTSAGRTARELLFSYLSPSQRDEAQRYGYFDVWIHNRSIIRLCLKYGRPLWFNTVRFRVWRGYPNGNVWMGLPQEDRFRYKLCIHPTTPYPTDDICLGQLTMILLDPEELIKHARLTPINPKRDPLPPRDLGMFDEYVGFSSDDLILPHYHQ